MAPADEMTSDSLHYGRWQDERTVLSSTLISDVNDSDRVDDKGEDDVFVLCDQLSRHLNDVGSEMFGGTHQIVGVQQIDNTEAQQTSDQVTFSSTQLKNQEVEVSLACNVCHKTFKSLSILECHKLFHTGLKSQTYGECQSTYNRDITKHRSRYTAALDVV